MTWRPLVWITRGAASFVALAPAWVAAQTEVQPDALEATPEGVFEPAPAAPAHDAASESAASEQAALEMQALIAETSVATEEPSDELSLRIYGFADAMYSKAWPSRKGAVYPPAEASFLVGNVNLYAASNLTHGFSSLVEVRFTYVPNGSIDFDTLEYQNTAAADESDYRRMTQWGGIVLERVHLDYSYSGWLNFRIGSFLTPYGIWNVDHGSPTIIPVAKPYVIGEQLFPVRQTGVAAYGSLLLGDFTLGYHFTLSNGRGDFEQRDFDHNKALGGRLTLSTYAIGALTLGVSGYGGRASRSPRTRVTSTDPILVETRSLDQFDELSFAADLLWEWRGLRLQGEIVTRQVRYDDPGRKLVSVGTEDLFLSDHTSLGSYVLAAYRTPWLGIMPYGIFQWFDRGYARDEVLVFGGNQVNAVGMGGGLNVRPVPAVALKAQFSYAWVPGVPSADNPNLSFQAAWAF